MCFVLALFMVCSFCSSWNSQRKQILTWPGSNHTESHVCVTRISAGPQRVIHWGWLTLGPCVTQRGAALSLKMMVCRQPSLLPMNLVRSFIHDVKYMFMD